MTGPFSVYGYDLSMLDAYHQAIAQSTPRESVVQVSDQLDLATAIDDSAPQHCSSDINTSSSGRSRSSCKDYLSTLPLEILSQILAYALPHTINLGPTRKRLTKDMQDKKWETVWLRGSISVLATCRRLYYEGRNMLYGNSTFLVDIHFDRIQFSHRWRSSKQTQAQDRVLTPQRKYDFLAQFSPETRALMRRFVLRLWVLDGYKGMIYHNVSNEIVLLKGLRAQVERFCDAVTDGVQLFAMIEGENYTPTKKEFVGVVVCGAGRRPVRPVRVDGMETDDWIVDPLHQLGRETTVRDEASGLPGI